MPAIAILGRVDPLGFSPYAGWVSPLAGVAFRGAALTIWRVGVRSYMSTGS